MRTVSDVARIHYELPDELHRRAKAAAAMRGQTLKDFLIQALESAVREAESKQRRSRGNASK